MAAPYPGALRFPLTSLTSNQTLSTVWRCTTSLVGGGISSSVTVMLLNPVTPLMALWMDTSMSTLLFLGVMCQKLGMEHQVGHSEVCRVLFLLPYLKIWPF